MTTNELKEAIAALAENKKRRRYSPELRAAVVAHAHARIAEGASAAAVCQELGVGEPTLARFLKTERPHPGRSRKRFRRVRVVAETRHVGLRVHGPSGLIVDGLSVGDVVMLWWQLSCLD